MKPIIDVLAPHKSIDVDGISYNILDASDINNE